MSTDYLVTKKNFVFVANKLNRIGVFTKNYTAPDRDGNLQTVGLRIGQRPDHVVAYFGDTIRCSDKGVFSVWRLTEVKPKPEMTWHTVSPDEEHAEAALAYEYEQAQIRATCQCEERRSVDYTLEIEEGDILIVHTVCGKRPWFMFNDFTECVSMPPQKIVVDVQTGCSGYECYSGSCDCGTEIHLKTPEGSW